LTPTSHPQRACWAAATRAASAAAPPAAAGRTPATTGGTTVGVVLLWTAQTASTAVAPPVCLTVLVLNPRCVCMCAAEDSSSEGWMVADKLHLPAFAGQGSSSSGGGGGQPNASSLGSSSSSSSGGASGDASSGSSVQLDIVFGCENLETGELYKQAADGVLGMGNSPNAVPRQVRVWHVRWQRGCGALGSGHAAVNATPLCRPPHALARPRTRSWRVRGACGTPSHCALDALRAASCCWVRARRALACLAAWEQHARVAARHRRAFLRADTATLGCLRARRRLRHAASGAAALHAAAAGAAQRVLHSGDSWCEPARQAAARAPGERCGARRAAWAQQLPRVCLCTRRRAGDAHARAVCCVSRLSAPVCRRSLTTRAATAPCLTAPPRLLTCRPQPTPRLWGSCRARSQARA
jgi:hypothetical protein